MALFRLVLCGSRGGGRGWVVLRADTGRRVPFLLRGAVSAQKKFKIVGDPQWHIELRWHGVAVIARPQGLSSATLATLQGSSRTASAPVPSIAQPSAQPAAVVVEQANQRIEVDTPELDSSLDVTSFGITSVALIGASSLATSATAADIANDAEECELDASTAAPETEAEAEAEQPEFALVEDGEDNHDPCGVDEDMHEDGAEPQQGDDAQEAQEAQDEGACADQGSAAELLEDEDEHNNTAADEPATEVDDLTAAQLHAAPAPGQAPTTPRTYIDTHEPPPTPTPNTCTHTLCLRSTQSAC